MTEAEWLAGADPYPKQTYVWGRAGDRKLRLAVCACCRLVWPHLGDRVRRAVEVAEGYADGRATAGDLAAAGRAVGPLSPSDDPISHPEDVAWLAVQPAVGADGSPNETIDAAVNVYCRAAVGWDEGTHYEHIYDKPTPPDVGAAFDRHGVEADGHISRLFGRVFGNPFRPVAADPAWLTPTVTALAAAIYEARAFDRLPVLADALEEAGCGNEDVPGHCRGDGPHVRGCWVVDLVLGKE